MSAENQPTETGLKTYREDVFLIISLKTVFENLHLVKSYNKINLNVFVPCLWEKYRWGLTSFGQYINIALHNARLCYANIKEMTGSLVP